MPYDYNDIARRYFEEIKPLFVNYLHKNFTLSYDDIADIYTDVWISVRQNIMNGTVRDNTNWVAYILRMGWNMANNRASRRTFIPSFDDESFNREEFENEYARQQAAARSVCEDPELQEVLAAVLSTIPEPCNRLLRLYYFERLSASQIADAMNYSSARSVITTNERCRAKLKARVEVAASRLGIID